MILPLAHALAAALTIGRTSPREVPTLPMWPHRVLAKQNLPDGDYLRAQVDGTGPDELVILTQYHTKGSSQVKVLVYRWRARFVELGRVDLSSLKNLIQPAAGDFNGDGRDEIYVASADGEIASVTFARGRLRVGRQTVRSALQVTSVAVSTSSNGRALLAGLGTSLSGEDPRLVTLSRHGSEWVPAAPLHPKCGGMDFEFVPDDGNASRGDLFARHRPSGIDEITYSRLATLRAGLHEAERTTGGPFPPRGMEWWVGVTSGLRPSTTTILSKTSYLLAGGATIERGELLDWRRSTVVKRFRLPGLPLVSGAFRRAGEPVLLVRGEKSEAQMLAPIQGRKRPVHR
jgi:hypothetical protein